LPLPGKKYLVGGSICDTTERRYSLWRIFEDGTLDTTFDTHCTQGYTWQLAVLPDGKYLTLSELKLPGYSLPINLMRWNTDGSVDSTFNYYPYINYHKSIKSFFLYGSKIIVSGEFDTIYGQACHGMATLNYDGFIDTSLFSQTCGPDSAPLQWTPGIYRYKLTPGGELLISGFFTWFSGLKTFGMVRLKPFYVGIDDKPKSDNKIFTISPNPATNRLKINFQQADQGEITVVDMTGRHLKNCQIHRQTLQYNLNINDLSPGIYFLNYRSKTHSIYCTKKLIVVN
jgi:hypothetical protein